MATKAELEAKISELQKQIEEFTNTVVRPESYDVMIKSLKDELDQRRTAINDLKVLVENKKTEFQNLKNKFDAYYDAIEFIKQMNFFGRLGFLFNPKKYIQL